MQGHARFLAKTDGVLSGLKVAEMVFARVNPDIKVTWTQSEGDFVTTGTYFGDAYGPARSLLAAERLVLNLMQRMSGIATLTHQFVQRINAVSSKTRILDTRKTAPGLRIVDKLAVLQGGGVNHRIGLYDMIMIKDNHIAAAGGITKAVQNALQYLSTSGNKVKVEVETSTLDEVKEALTVGGVDRIMLDNMVKVTRQQGQVVSVDTSMVSAALELIKGACEVEVSGNVMLDTVGEIAKTNVDYISSGALTHTVTAMDISMKIKLL